LVPATDKPHEFVFTFGNTIDKVLGISADSDNTVLFTKDMWKEHPAKNEEILQTVCFSASSNQGFRRPLVMTKDADHRAGLYKYEEVIAPIDLKKDQYLSDQLRTLTEIFVSGIRAINEPTKDAPWQKLEEANVKYLMSYIKSEVYCELLKDRDNKGKERAEEYLKKVLLTFFSIIPDSLIDKFDEGLKAHDKIRERLEDVPEGDTAGIEEVLKSQKHFKTIEDFNHFKVLRKYILSVKNQFNHFVWIMYRSKIGMVTLKKVKGQLSALFDFVVKVQDECEPLENKDLIKAISSPLKNYNTVVKDFLDKLYTRFEVQKLDKRSQAALCYKFQEECHYKYLNGRYKYWDSIEKEVKTLHQEEFRDLCLRYWGINEPNSYKPNKCKKEHKDKFSSVPDDKELWRSIKQ
jgi:hypothetical protein